MKRLIRLHTKLYPLLQPQDAVKLMYQRALGCGHMLPCECECADRIDRERAALAIDESVPPAVPVGGGQARLDLRSRDMYELPSGLIARIMARSAERVSGDIGDLKKSLTELSEICREGELPFSVNELSEYIEAYARDGYPVVSHSEIYRKEYRPAYRVADARYAPLLPLIGEISESEKPVYVVIDGMCASGKSTAAALLGELFGANVFHTDDYFLPPEMRTAKRLREPGGNVDYARFSSEVLAGLISGEAFEYHPYSCQTGRKRTASAGIAPVTIIEGAYSLHPAFDEAYERLHPITCFIETDADTQRRRVLQRNGEEMLARFEQIWIPLEKRYFEAYDVKERAGRAISMEDEL